MKILVIDDEPTILELVTAFLNSSAHHEAHSALSAKAALEAMAEAEDAFDCFLVDIQMPDVDGVSLANLVRKTPGYEDTPIIMLTAMRDKTYLDRAFAAGATDYATKPIDFVDLQRRLRAAQTLSIDKTRRRGQSLIARKLGGLAGAPKDVRKSDPLPLPGIDAAIDYGEFENYAMELMRRQPHRVKTLAVKIANVDRVYDEYSSEDFRSLVCVAAKAIQDTLLSDSGVLSYRGNGVFLCIQEGNLKARRNALQNGLNSRFHALRSEDDGPDLPQLLVSDRVPLRKGTAVNALESMAAAVECAESRDNSLGDMFDMPRRFLKRPRLNDEQRHLEKRAFESLLREALAQPQNDAWCRSLARRAEVPG